MYRTCAAHAAIVHLEDLLLCFHHQGVVDPNFTIFILDDCNLFAMAACTTTALNGLPATLQRHL